MNCEKVKEAVRKLAEAQNLIKEASDLLDGEGIGLCTGNLPKYGWQILPKGNRENGIGELAKAIGATIEYEPVHKWEVVKTSGTSFFA